MSYSSPNYAKRRGGSSAADILYLILDDIIAALETALASEYYEPMTAEGNIMFTTDGDIVMGYNGTLALVAA